MVPVVTVTGRKESIVAVQGREVANVPMPLPVAPAVVFVPIAAAIDWSAPALSWLSNTSFNVAGEVAVQAVTCCCAATPAIIMTNALLVTEVNPVAVTEVDEPLFVVVVVSNGFAVSTPVNAMIDPVPSRTRGIGHCAIARITVAKKRNHDVIGNNASRFVDADCRVVVYFGDCRT